MFRRPTDPVEYNNLYALPGAVLVGGCAAGQLAGTAVSSARLLMLHCAFLHTLLWCGVLLSHCPLLSVCRFHSQLAALAV